MKYRNTSLLLVDKQAVDKKTTKSIYNSLVCFSVFIALEILVCLSLYIS